MMLIAKEVNVRKQKFYVNYEQNAPMKTLNLLFISDIHRRKLSKSFVKKIDTHIDYVVLGGDLAESTVPIKRLAHNLKTLSSIAPVFYVWGNNDREIDEKDLRKLCSAYNITLLENEHCQLPSHSDWAICGTEDPSSYEVNIFKTMLGTSTYRHLIFVSHQPTVWEEVELLKKPTIMLAGHTHGGQIRCGKFGIGERGSTSVNDGRLKLISNGYGTTQIPMRLGAHPESHILTIFYKE